MLVELQKAVSVSKVSEPVPRADDSFADPVHSLTGSGEMLDS